MTANPPHHEDSTDTPPPTSQSGDTVKRFDRERWTNIIATARGSDDHVTKNQLIDSIAAADIPELNREEARAAIEYARDQGILEEYEEDGLMFPGIRVASRSPPTDLRMDGTESGVGGEGTVDGEDGDPDAGLEARVHEAFVAAIDFFNERLDDEFPESVDVDADSPREYFRRRGWSDDTIDDAKLGYAPASDSALLEAINHAVKDDDETFVDSAVLQGTGLFWDDLTPIWQGRVVLPYFDDDGDPVFAISRRIGHTDDDAGKYGEDDDPAKYHKIPQTDDVLVSEPIFGVNTVEPGDDVIITEGIADAITAHQAGYSAVSPVTTRFKKRDRERLVDVFDDREVGRIYVAQDAERPSSDLPDPEGADDITDLEITQHGEGFDGALDTAVMLEDEGFDVRLVEFPRPGLDKVDLDDYLTDWSDSDMSAVLASAKPATEHPAFCREEYELGRAQASQSDGFDPSDLEDRTDDGAGDGSGVSGIYSLTAYDVLGIDDDYRGANPLGHRGESEDYTVATGDGMVYDHKRKVAYTGLTALLVEAGERDIDAPNGSLSDREHFVAWKTAKERGLIPSDDPVPYRGLCYILRDEEIADADEIPESGDTGLSSRAYNTALDVIDHEYDLDPGRDPVSGAAPSGIPDQYDVDPLSLEVVLDVALTHRAVQECTPTDLANHDDTDAGGRSLTGEDTEVVESPDGDAWITDPEGANGDADDGELHVVRAALVAADELDADGAATATLDDTTWTRGYRLAREVYGAPLPEYLTAADVTEHYTTVEHVVRAARSWNLADDYLAKHRTVNDPSDGPVAGRYDFEDSESGERLVEFESGLFYCWEHDNVVDPVRAVAVWDGIIDDCDCAITGDDFRDAYRATRRAGAPFPEWRAGSPEHITMLPAAGDVVDELSPDADDLQEFRKEVEDHIATLAGQRDAAKLVNVPAGGGKTTGAVKLAANHADPDHDGGRPISIFEQRREMMKEVEDKAREYGARWRYLPILGGSPSNAAVGDLTSKIIGGEPDDEDDELRDVICELSYENDPADSRALLRADPDTLFDDVLDVDPLAEDDPRDKGSDNAFRCDACGQEFGSLEAKVNHMCFAGASSPGHEVDDEDDIELLNPDGTQRGTCGAADAPDYGGDAESVEDLDDDERDRLAWSIRVHAARNTGFAPRDIHERDEWLFGESLPCHHDDRSCRYSEEWDRINDPNPGTEVDLLIGHYVHFYTSGAKTYVGHREKDDGELVPVIEPRTVFIDEYPGTAYMDAVGTEAVDYALWLGRALSDDIDGKQDLYTEPTDDETIHNWLHGEAGDEGDGYDRHTMLARALARLTGDAGIEKRSLWELADEAQRVADHVEPRYQDLADALRYFAENPVDRLWPALDRLHDRLTDDEIDIASEADQKAVNTAARISTELEEIVTVLDADRGETLVDALEDLANPLPECGALREAVERLISAAQLRADNLPERAEGVLTMLRGGEDGVRELAATANDPDAHPHARLMLAGAVLDGEHMDLEHFDLSEEIGGIDSVDDGEPELLKRVEIGNEIVLWSRDDRGAYVSKPPDSSTSVGQSTVICLDATGRPELWEIAIGRDIELAGLFDDDEARREFIRDVMNLQVIQTSPFMNFWEGTPTRDFDDVIGLVEEVAAEYSDHLLRKGSLSSTTAPGVITTHVVEQEIKDRIEDVIEAIDHYGNIKGSNELAALNIGIVLGTQHFGDHEVEKMAALGGETIEKTGRGTTLDYGSEVGNAMRDHMSKDQTMQAIMRFGRDEGGAIVFAHTAALRADLPVVGRGRVVTTYSPTEHEVATAIQGIADPDTTFVRSDVEQAMSGDVSSRHVRRVLAEFTETGVIHKVGGGPGVANEYAGEDVSMDAIAVVLPDPPGPILDGCLDRDPDEPSSNTLVYTANVRVDLEDDVRDTVSVRAASTIPAPSELITPGERSAIPAAAEARQAADRR